jgi:hypothetical protein
MIRGRLQITQAVAEAGGRLDWKSPKDHERRSVPFPAFLVDELDQRMLGKGRDDLISRRQTVARSGCLTGAACVQCG